MESSNNVQIKVERADQDGGGNMKRKMPFNGNSNNGNSNSNGNSGNFNNGNRSFDSNRNDGVKRMKNQTVDDCSDHTVTIRLLIHYKQAGSFIGKGGEVINTVRKKYNLNVQVPDSKSPERVVTFTGQVANILGSMETALEQLDKSRVHKCKEQSELRVLIHESIAGCVIGKQGKKIKEIKENTGAYVKCYNKCCPYSTDRVVLINGGREGVTKALGEVIKIMIELPTKGNFHDYDPAKHDNKYVAAYGGYMKDGSDPQPGEDPPLAPSGPGGPAPMIGAPPNGGPPPPMGMPGQRFPGPGMMGGMPPRGPPMGGPPPMGGYPPMGMPAGPMGGPPMGGMMPFGGGGPMGMPPPNMQGGGMNNPQGGMMPPQGNYGGMNPNMVNPQQQQQMFNNRGKDSMQGNTHMGNMQPNFQKNNSSMGGPPMNQNGMGSHPMMGGMNSQGMNQQQQPPQMQYPGQQGGDQMSANFMNQMMGMMGGGNMMGTNQQPQNNPGGSSNQMPQMGGGMGSQPQGGQSSGNEIIPPPLIAPNEKKEEYTLSNAEAGAVIGQNGQTIKIIRMKSGTRIDVGETVPGTDRRIVTIIGQVQQVEAAKKLLYEYASRASGFCGSS